MRTLNIICFLTVAIALQAQTIKIGLFYSNDINSLTISVRQGKYRITSNGKTLGEYKKGNIFYVIKHDNKFDLRDKKNYIGSFQNIEIEAQSENGLVTLKPVNPAIEAREYHDNIVLDAASDKFKIINKIDMEKYIAEVIEAESGVNAKPEFYKAQAILIRTYTIKNMFKHAEEGFNLCDEVHCQAYHGRKTASNNEIYNATKTTAGMVLIDEDSNLILSPFHANCGGMTSASGMVWQSNLKYIQPVKCPFCDKGVHYSWTKSITKEEWRNFLQENKVPKTLISDTDFTYDAVVRKKYLNIGNYQIPTRSIREKFGLKSTFFSIHPLGNKIEFVGRGYGHGAGMCQEGAMEMAKVNYTYLDIIHFYFKDIAITDYREMSLEQY